VLRRRAPHLIVLLAALAGVLVLTSTSAQAGGTTTTVYCTGAPGGTATGSPGLQTTLDNVSNGDTVIIDGLCTGSFELPASFNGFDGGFTLEGEPGTTSGFDGQGTDQGGPLLWGTVGDDVGANTMIENLTFENAVLTSPSSVQTGAFHGLISGDSALGLEYGFPSGATSESLTLSHDTFTNDAGGDVGGYDWNPVMILVDGDGDGHCPSTPSDYALSIADSQFSHDTLSVDDPIASFDGTGGGGLSLILNCAATTSLTDNDFTDDTLTTAGGSDGQGLGGGLAIWGYGSNFEGAVAPVTQQGNEFDGDAIIEDGGLADFGGGGEWADAVDVSSTDDSFTNNTIPGTSGEDAFQLDQWSSGAGLAVVQDGCSRTAITSTLTQDVIAANKIDDSDGGESTEADGAALGVGTFDFFECSSYNDDGLTLDDTTVTNNVVTPSGSAVAGIFDTNAATVALQNTILSGEEGGAEAGGSGSFTATYSDLCSGTSPYTGTGNICANPLLVGGIDAHETSTSPTIDAGSNALVPSGLTTDFYGTARELNGSAATCAATPSGIVDIGAAEYAPSCVTTPVTTTTTSTTTTTTTTAHTCTSRRDFLMHPRIDFNLRADELITEIKATFGPRHVTEIGTNLQTVRIDLRGLPKGAYTVRITVHEPHGQILHLQHVFHTCAPVAIHWPK